MKNVYAKILEEYKYRRLSEKITADENYESALKDDEFRRIDMELRGITLDIVKSDSPSGLIAKQKELKKLWEKRLWEIGFSPADLSPKYSCKICKDTGIVNGKVCSCVKQALLGNLKSKNITSSLMNFTFSDCNPTLLSETRQAKALSALYKKFAEIGDKFPDTKKLNIVLSGEMGVGKTCLLSALANSIRNRGFSVLWLTSFELNNIFLTYHTAMLNDRVGILEGVLNSDLLVIDDLGTEPLLRNVTLEYLLVVLTERASKKLHTYISTNLTDDQILDRYGERIFSRMFDKNSTFYRRITGDDLRIKRN
ncbi:MAG: ATP-binding protein [Christensenellales bacterium]